MHRHISSENLAKISQLLSEPPPAPVKGRGNSRCLFPFVRRQNGFGLAIWKEIPLAHKAELHYGDAGRSAFQYRGVNGNIVISPEAYQVLRQLEIV